MKLVRKWIRIFRRRRIAATNVSDQYKPATSSVPKNEIKDDVDGFDKRIQGQIPFPYICVGIKADEVKLEQSTRKRCKVSTSQESHRKRSRDIIVNELPTVITEMARFFWLFTD